MMRSRWIVAAALFLAAVNPAIAQKSKATLGTEITSSFPDNTTGAITPATSRSAFNDFVASWQQAPQVNAQTGTTYAFIAADYGKMVTFSNGSSIAVTLPQPIGTFAVWNVFAVNLGVGTVTITPSGSTINSASTLVLATGQWAFLVSDGSGTNYSATGYIATLPASLFPALTGVVTTPGGSLTTSFGSAAATTVLGNVTGSPAVPTYLTGGQVGSILCVPSRTVLTSGTSQTYTTPTCNGVTATWLEVEVQGGGGGGLARARAASPRARPATHRALARSRRTAVASLARRRPAVLAAHARDRSARNRTFPALRAVAA